MMWRLVPALTRLPSGIKEKENSSSLITIQSFKQLMLQMSSVAPSLVPAQLRMLAPLRFKIKKMDCGVRWSLEKSKKNQLITSSPMFITKINLFPNWKALVWATLISMEDAIGMAGISSHPIWCLARYKKDCRQIGSEERTCKRWRKDDLRRRKC